MDTAVLLLNKLTREGWMVREVNLEYQPVAIGKAWLSSGAELTIRMEHE
jgi:hypothetical protein